MQYNTYNQDQSLASQGNRVYERWEVCVSSRHNINSYVGYCKAQFQDDKRKYIIVKARGNAIENALKVVQLVKENIGGIHSITKLNLQYTSEKVYIDQKQTFGDDISAFSSNATFTRKNPWKTLPGT